MERLAKTAIDPLVEHQPISQTMVLDVAYKADTAKKKRRSEEWNIQEDNRNDLLKFDG